MAEIGNELRERRIREKIDVQQVEEATKIRAKYLRALENEEFELIPGNAYVKSFLRTYADYLGLDGRSLVESYKNQFERHDDPDEPIVPSRFEPAQERVGNGRLVVVAVAVVALVLVGLLLVGSFGGKTKTSGPAEQSSKTKPTSSKRSSTDNGASESTPAQPVGKTFAFSVTARSTVLVCVEDASGQVRIASKVLAPGDKTPAITATALNVRVANGVAVLAFGGQSQKVRASKTPEAYRVTASEATSLPAGQAPDCS